MSTINGTCENLLMETLSEVKKLDKKIVKIEFDIDHVKKDISEGRDVVNKIDSLILGISDIKTTVTIIDNKIKSSERTMDKIQASLKEHGERMEKMKTNITDVKTGLNEEISDVRLQVAKLKVREAVVWTIMGLVLTGVIGFIFTFLTRMLPPYYYGYGG